jgi:single-strand DNA-binding protein
MNGLRNSVRLFGNVGMEPEIKALENGNKLAKFSLATSEKHKDAKGNWVEETTWHNLVVWGKPVDSIEKYVNKGDRIMVEGKISNRSYESKDGVKKYVTEIIVNEFLLAGTPKVKAAGVADSDENLPF